MGKMHELLAAESSVTTVYNKMKDETIKVLSKPELLTRKVKKTSYFDSQQAANLNTVDATEMTTTVPDRLKYFYEGALAKSLDLIIQKDSTNQKAVADIVLPDGTVMAQSVPGVTLLALETKLTELRGIVEAAPTLAPGFEWVASEQNPNTYEAKNVDVSFKTQKNLRPIILTPATDKFPAQIEKISEDQPIARLETQTWSGMISSATKMDLLSQIDTLFIAVKQARQRANLAEVVPAKIGGAVVDYLLAPLK